MISKLGKSDEEEDEKSRYLQKENTYHLWGAHQHRVTPWYRLTGCSPSIALYSALV